MSCSNSCCKCSKSCELIEHPDRPNQYFCKHCKKSFQEKKEESFNWLLFLIISLFTAMISISIAENQNFDSNQLNSTTQQGVQVE